MDDMEVMWWTISSQLHLYIFHNSPSMWSGGRYTGGVVEDNVRATTSRNMIVF